MGYAVDSGSEDFGSDGGRLGSMRARAVAKRPSSRRFEDAKYDDSDDDEDLTRYGSLSGTSFAVHKIPSIDESQEDLAPVRGRVSSHQLSRSGKFYDGEDSYSDFTETKESDFTSGRSHFDAGRTATTLDSLEQTGEHSSGSGARIDMERTVDTDVSDFADHRDTEAVHRAADNRIKAAARQQLRRDIDDDAPFLSPPPSHQSSRHRVPSTAASSPFDGLNSDLDEGSLVLSESGDTFGDLETSSRSFR